ncbi:MAG: FAD-dependent thymidylate synthase [Chloroflexi bacterium]|nr:FAD-dependent thymidylate synthase [Chloroflexota bacterium]
MSTDAPTVDNGERAVADTTTAAAPLPRDSVPALDAILGQPLRVLDDGFVRVVDYMGSDVAIVQAARVSYGAGTRRLREDRGLIRYLMRHAHSTPFEMCEIKLHVRVPMDIWRQWIRHRTANVNEYSTRYSVAIDAAQRTPPDAWRQQSTANRQGSSGRLDAATGAHLTVREAEVQALARAVYEERLVAGVAREQARKDLPLSTYTEAYWKIDLHNLMHFLRLRMDSHAQEEIQQYARTIGDEIVARWCPLAWEAFREYAVNGLMLTEGDVAIIGYLTAGQPAAAVAEAERRSLLPRADGQLRPNRERAELEAKLVLLGLTAPWA